MSMCGWAGGSCREGGEGFPPCFILPRARVAMSPRALEHLDWRPGFRASWLQSCAGTGSCSTVTSRSSGLCQGGELQVFGSKTTPAMAQGMQNNTSAPEACIRHHCCVGSAQGPGAESRAVLHRTKDQREICTKTDRARSLGIWSWEYPRLIAMYAGTKEQYVGRLDQVDSDIS